MYITFLVIPPRNVFFFFILVSPSPMRSGFARIRTLPGFFSGACGVSRVACGVVGRGGRHISPPIPARVNA